MLQVADFVTASVTAVGDGDIVLTRPPLSRSFWLL